MLVRNLNESELIGFKKHIEDGDYNGTKFTLGVTMMPDGTLLGMPTFSFDGSPNVVTFELEDLLSMAAKAAGMSDDGVKRSKTDLRDCPFCGGEALYEGYHAVDGFEMPVMFCNSCKAMVTFEGYEDYIGEGEHDGMNELRAAWNTRAERTCEVVGERTIEYEGGYAGSDHEWDLSCGHTLTIDYEPDYCYRCGAKVVG